jgi:hypothetical protein
MLGTLKTGTGFLIRTQITVRIKNNLLGAQIFLACGNDSCILRNANSLHRGAGVSLGGRKVKIEFSVPSHPIPRTSHFHQENPSREANSLAACRCYVFHGVRRHLRY